MVVLDHFPSPDRLHIISGSMSPSALSQPLAPLFSLRTSYYDQSTLWGRTQTVVQSLNPMLCLETESSLEGPRMLMRQAKEGTLPKGKYSDAELWGARLKVEACVHAPTNSVIFPLFRMCAFVPANYFIVPFMMAPSTISSVPRTIFAHWLNQSYNASVNYSNRAGDTTDINLLVQAYAMAVTVSVSGALVATNVMKRMGGGQSVGATLARAFLPMGAVAASGIANLLLMRKEELTDGVPIMDDDGNVRGKSVVAGRIGLAECAAARVLWNIPCMTLPPLLAPFLARAAIFRAHPSRAELLLIYAGVAIGVPPAIAYFPQRETVDASKLEDRFREMKNADGRLVESFTFNKGI